MQTPATVEPEPEDETTAQAATDPEVVRLASRLMAEGTPKVTAHTIAASYVMLYRLFSALESFGSSPMGRSIFKRIGRSS